MVAVAADWSSSGYLPALWRLTTVAKIFSLEVKVSLAGIFAMLLVLRLVLEHFVLHRRILSLDFAPGCGASELLGYGDT